MELVGVAVQLGIDFPFCSFSIPSILILPVTAQGFSHYLTKEKKNCLKVSEVWIQCHKVSTVELYLRIPKIVESSLPLLFHWREDLFSGKLSDVAEWDVAEIIQPVSHLTLCKSWFFLGRLPRQKQTDE